MATAAKKRVRRPRRRRIQLNPVAVKAFYERELDDWRWLKEVPREELDKLVPEGFKFITKPRDPQLVGFLLGIKMPRFLYFLDMGGGKSKLLLDLIRYRKFCGDLTSALICVPNVINFASWENQLALHAPDLTYKVLTGDKATRYEMLDEEPSDVYLICYAGLSVYMAQSKRKTRKGKMRREMVVEDSQQFSSMFNFLALDECHLSGLSRVSSLNYGLLKLISWGAQCCYAASGTPMSKDPIKMWPQFHVVDKGETLGSSLAMFQSAYFKEKESYWAGIEFVFDQKKRLHLNKALQHRSIRYKDKELAKTPGMRPPIRIPVQMTQAQINRNEELVRLGKEARANDEVPPNVFVRQRQTAAGFIAVKGEDDVKLETAFTPNPKGIALAQLLEELGEEKKIVIFHCYIYSGILIQEILDKLKIKHCGVGHGYKDPRLQLSRFMKDPKYRAFVANVQAGGTGVDGLQSVCHYGVFYETPTSPSLRKQAEKRLDRDGQTMPVYIYDLVAKGINVDERTLASIAVGRDIFEAIVDGKEKIK